ncbi:2-phospho-L-lactate transferase [Nitrincola sp. MINF-07-Sa-05]|uniref:2-phospho-L-lactate transferase n=1 Tax=Nitrincola salilacus TaxID=3400273 RepID=UPI00391807A6
MNAQTQISGQISGQISDLPKQPLRITLLAGGVGGAKMAEGLMHSHYCNSHYCNSHFCNSNESQNSNPLKIIGNVADDQTFHGLWVSPDIDTLIYTLADMIDRDKGWGLAGDTDHTLKALNRLGRETWMLLGDQDFATHIYRTEQRALGVRPSEIAANIARQLGVKAEILLPTDDVIQSWVSTDKGWLDFQDYFVRERCEPAVKSFTVIGADNATPTPEALRAIAEADLLVLAPSNPIASIGAILAVPGIRQAVLDTSAYRIAVSPLIQGETVKGPADKMMQASGFSADVLGVADCYQGLIDGMLIDQLDRDAISHLQARGLDVLATDTLMQSRQSKIRVAETLVQFYLSHCQSHCGQRLTESRQEGVS